MAGLGGPTTGHLQAGSRFVDVQTVAVGVQPVEREVAAADGDFCRRCRDHGLDVRLAGDFPAVERNPIAKTPEPRGQLARRIDEPKLYHLTFAQLARNGPGEGWTEVFTSRAGNVLLVERRVLNCRLVLTCERGIVEIDVSGLPEEVVQTAQVNTTSGLGVVGRIDGGAFAVTYGTPEPWGLSNVKPATLIGSPNQTILDLPGLVESESD